MPHHTWVSPSVNQSVRPARFNHRRRDFPYQPSFHHTCRVTVSEQTATLFAARFRLLVKRKPVVHRTAERGFEGIAAGIAVAARLRFIAKIRLEVLAALTAENSGWLCHNQPRSISGCGSSPEMRHALTCRVTAEISRPRRRRDGTAEISATLRQPQQPEAGCQLPQAAWRMPAARCEHAEARCAVRAALRMHHVVPGNARVSSVKPISAPRRVSTTGGGIFHTNLLSITPCRVTVSEQTATLLAARFRLLKAKNSSYTTAERGFEGIAAGCRCAPAFHCQDSTGRSRRTDGRNSGDGLPTQPRSISGCGSSPDEMRGDAPHLPVRR